MKLLGIRKIFRFACN